jgi:hypothetical protein
MVVPPSIQPGISAMANSPPRWRLAGTPKPLTIDAEIHAGGRLKGGIAVNNEMGVDAIQFDCPANVTPFPDARRRGIAR